MQNLCVDIGNSLAKFCIFRENKLLQKEIRASFNEKSILELLEKFPQTENMIVCSVRGSNLKIRKNVLKKFNNVIEFNETTPIPVENLYATKETLGRDRLAAIVGANNMFPASNVLVVDAGTAITFDFINSKEQYLGGNISPGLSMRFKALHHFTGKLPLLEPNDDFTLLAKNTTGAIRSGVINGMIFEIEGYIHSLKEKHKGLKTILTGGDAIFFDKKLKNTIFVDQNLVLTGLNRIIEYNVNKT
jgi:type III pantothenate kinase